MKRIEKEKPNAFKDFCMMKITINNCGNKCYITNYKPAIISLDFKALQFQNGEIEYLPDGDVEKIIIL